MFFVGNQIAKIHWVIEKATEFKKSIYFCFIDYAKAFDCVDHNKLWKILQEMGITRSPSRDGNTIQAFPSVGRSRSNN